MENGSGERTWGGFKVQCSLWVGDRHFAVWDKKKCIDCLHLKAQEVKGKLHNQLGGNELNDSIKKK